MKPSEHRAFVPLLGPRWVPGHWRVLVLVLAFIFAAVATAPSFAQLSTEQTFPALTARIVDNAALIDEAAEQELNEKLAAFEAKSSDQIVVATIADLDGEAIEPYANRLFRHWQLGQAGEDNGVLLLVSRDDRRMRIEVGYGLEGVLTDLHSRFIIENTMAPAFRNGDFSGGIAAAVDDIIMVLEGDGAELEARARRNQPVTGVDWEEFFLITLFVTLFFGTFAFALLARIFGRRLGPERYKWLGVEITYGGGAGGSSSSSSGGGWSSSGGGFSGGGGSSGGGGASGSW